MMVPQRLFLLSSDDKSPTFKWGPQSLPKSLGFLPKLIILLLTRRSEDSAHSCGLQSNGRLSPAPATAAMRACSKEIPQ